VTQDYTYAYNTYPISSEETAMEGALKRFTPMPNPKDVYDFALMGLPKYFPLTREPITIEMVKPFLDSAVTEIEMELGCNISEVAHYHSEDYIDGMFTNNYMGTRLQRWPATSIVSMQLKYPHTNTPTPYQKYTIPANWIMLRRNRVNVVAAMGAVTVSTDNSATVTAGGIFTFITGFSRGAYGPGSIEVIYKAGFKHDQLPSSVADLIKTWAAYRWLQMIIPVLFPQTSVSVGIDGVNQSVTLNMYAALVARLAEMEKKKMQLSAALTKSFGRTAKMSFIGS